MQRKNNWREKLDEGTIDFLDGYRKASDARRKLTDDAEWRATLKEIATEHPQILDSRRVEVLPEFLQILLNSEVAAPLLSATRATSGIHTMSELAARFVERMQTATLALQDPDNQILLGYVLAIITIVPGGMYTNISKARFGDAGPQTKEERAWTLGETLESLGKTFKTGKAPDTKGRVNVEQIELIKRLRKDQKSRLTYRELQSALEYAGVYIDEETLRLFEFRAKNRGWIKPSEAPPDT